MPSLPELYSERLQVISFVLLMLGLAGVTLSAALGHERAVQASCVVLVLGLGAFALNVGKILSHLFRPRLVPFGAPKVVVSP